MKVKRHHLIIWAVMFLILGLLLVIIGLSGKELIHADTVGSSNEAVKIIIGSGIGLLAISFLMSVAVFY